MSKFKRDSHAPFRFCGKHKGCRKGKCHIGVDLARRGEAATVGYGVITVRDGKTTMEQLTADQMVERLSARNNNLHVEVENLKNQNEKMRSVISDMDKTIENKDKLRIEERERYLKADFHRIVWKYTACILFFVCVVYHLNPVLSRLMDLIIR